MNIWPFGKKHKGLPPETRDKVRGVIDMAAGAPSEKKYSTNPDLEAIAEAGANVNIKPEESIRQMSMNIKPKLKVPFLTKWGTELLVGTALTICAAIAYVGVYDPFNNKINNPLNNTCAAVVEQYNPITSTPMVELTNPITSTETNPYEPITIPEPVTPEITAPVTITPEITAPVTITPEITAPVTITPEITAPVTITPEITAPVTITPTIVKPIKPIVKPRLQPVKIEPPKTITGTVDGRLALFGDGIEGRLKANLIGKDRGYNFIYSGGSLNPESDSVEKYRKTHSATQFELWGTGDNRLKLGVNKGIEKEEITSSSTSYSDHPTEIISFKQWDDERLKEENTVRLTSIIGDKDFNKGKLNIFVGHSERSEAKKNEYDLGTLVVFTDPTILPFNSSTNVKANETWNESTLFGRVKYDCSDSLQIGGFGKIKNIDIRADIDVNGIPAGKYHDTLGTSFLGAELTHKDKEASRSATFIKNFGDGATGKSSSSWDLTLVNDSGLAIGGGGWEGNGYYDVAFSLWGDKLSDNTRRVLTNRKDNRIYSEYLLPNQRFSSLYDSLGGNGVTAFAEFGKYNKVFGVDVNYKDYNAKWAQEIVDKSRNSHFEIGKGGIGAGCDRQVSPAFKEPVDTFNLFYRRKF